MSLLIVEILTRVQRNEGKRRRRARSRASRPERRRPDLAEARGVLFAMGLGAILWAVGAGLVYACWPSG